MTEDRRILNLIQRSQEQHYKDDNLRFNIIMKTQEKHEELMKINGEHMSHIRKDLTEVSGILLKNSEEAKFDRGVLNNHIKRVEPMLLSYEKDDTFNSQLSLRSQKWGMRLGLFAAAISSWFVIKGFLISSLK